MNAVNVCKSFVGRAVPRCRSIFFLGTRAAIACLCLARCALYFSFFFCNWSIALGIFLFFLLHPFSTSRKGTAQDNGRSRRVGLRPALADRLTDDQNPGF
nr:hypothetical protein [Pandoravirus belohorizontensis]